MPIPDSVRRRLVLPAVCAPMFLVSNPDLVVTVCCAGVVGALPAHNVRTLQQFETWLAAIRSRLAEARSQGIDPAPVAVNLPVRLTPAERKSYVRLCRDYGVEILINAIGDPAELTALAHQHDLLVWADAINLRFARKAIAAGVDGITAIGSGGGGHSGTVSHLVLVAAIRREFTGTLLMAGAISNGAAIRASEILGADLAYLGTRFIATKESAASPQYKQMIVDAQASDIVYTGALTRAPANWLQASLAAAGIDADAQAPAAVEDSAAVQEKARPWVDVWSAGQGAELIDDIPDAAALIDTLRQEYRAACSVAAFSGRD